MVDITIARVALFWYIALIVIQVVSSLAARTRRQRVPDLEASSAIGLVLLAFEGIRRFWNSVLSLKVLSVAACVYCLIVLGRRAARGERWSAGEMNLVAFACFCAAKACIDVPAAAVTLMVVATIAATIATAMFVRLASGSSAPAR